MDTKLASGLLLSDRRPIGNNITSMLLNREVNMYLAIGQTNKFVICPPEKYVSIQQIFTAEQGQNSKLVFTECNGNFGQIFGKSVLWIIF